MADTPSKLSSGNIYYQGKYIPIEEYRTKITARSLYSIGNEYKNTSKFSLNNKNGVAESISTVLTVIPQYNRIQVNTNLLGNTYDAFRDEGSALTKIGLIMLGKQMAYNSAMNLSVKYLPSIDLSQALKGNTEDIFKFNEDNTISVKNKADRTFLDKVGDVSSKIFGIETYNVIGDDNPFNKIATNIDYIRNTGKAQLSRLFGGLNLNPYKPINPNRVDSTVIVEYSNDVGPKLQSSSDALFSNNNTTYKPFFNFDDNKAHPYFRRQLSFNSSIANINATETMILSYSITGDTVQEYAPNYQYIKDNFGEATKLITKNEIDNWVNTESNFTEDNNDKQIVWGRDGLAPEANTYIKDLRGIDDSVDLNDDNGIFNSNNIRKGLLEYTRNLLNASEGNFVDITRKAFKDGNDIVGFNGSPLWKSNNSKYSSDSGNDDKTGVRQHTILDPYDKFAKLIRFKGNVVYNGNENSVINKTVLPRIHPTIDIMGNIDNNNLMFSLENLAIGTIKREKFGIIDDEDGTAIPLSEVGQFGGRKMWFPPYNLHVNEVAIAKNESTVMVGRNEPIYNYMNSERTAVLSFSLLVDYPEQLRNINLVGDNKNKAIADFFAFGGDPLPDEYQIEKIEEKIEELKAQIENEGGLVEQAPILVPKNSPVSIFFQNNSPEEGQESTIIQTMYDNRNHYEIIEGCLSAQDGNGFGLNDKIYFIEGLVETNSGDEANKYILIGGIDQYSAINIKGQYESICLLNQDLSDVYGDDTTRKYFNIRITGTASKLYLTENEKVYNEALSKRRVEAAKELIKRRLTVMFGQSAADEIINNQTISVSTGSVGQSDDGADADKMHERPIKEERAALIEFYRNTVPVDKKEQNLTQKQKDDIAKIQQDIQNLELQLNVLKKNIGESVFEDRNKAILNSFESISGNQFYPTFHSQTPEDFHRRLTFLQQCTRQGAAKRFDVVDENGQLRARNSVFGKQPICVLRVGDLLYTKVIIDSVTIDYNDTTWDLNPEGFGLQPMIANITLQMKLIGGQSLKGPIDALQNAVSFNYYANSSFSDKGVYRKSSKEAENQEGYINGVLTTKNGELNTAYDNLINIREGEE